MSDKDIGEAQGVQDFEGDGGTPSERRTNTRHLACFLAHLETAEGVPRSALIRDLSVSGALLLTRAALAMGSRVKLSLYVREGAPPYPAMGRVVREDRRPSELMHPWTRAVAVQFETPIPELADDAKALAERQAALLGRRSAASK